MRNHKKKPSGFWKPFLAKISLLRSFGFVGFTLLTILICFWGQFPASLQTLPNQIAKIRIVADRSFSYVSKIKTDRQKENYKRQIAPIYRIDDAPLARFEEKINHLEVALNELAEKIHADTDESRDVILKAWQKNFEREEGLYINIDDLQLIVTKVTKAKRSEIFSEGLILLRDVVREGIFAELPGDGETGNYFFNIQIEGRSGEGEVQTQRDALRHLSLNTASLDIDWSVARTLFRIIKSGVEPNLIYDAEGSEKKVKEVLKTIEPVIVRVDAGDTIIEPGSVIGPEQSEQLQAYHTFLRENDDMGIGFNITFRERSVLAFLILGAALIILLMVFPKKQRKPRVIYLMGIMFLVNMTFIRIVFELGDTQLFGDNPYFVSLIPHLTPLVFAPMVVMLLQGASAAVLMTILISVFYSLMLGSLFTYLIISLLTGIVAISLCYKLRIKTKLIKVGAASGLLFSLLTLLLSSLGDTPGFIAFIQIPVSVITGAVTSALVVGILPSLEKTFRITTDMTLLELTDYNHPLLRRLQVEAPGTYHHSLMVANLAERAAMEIGANELLCRTCSLYHDIGKLVKPDYFIENQKGSHNPHLDRNPSMSALVIKSHVKEGEVIARRAKLPGVIIDVINQHHGTTLIRYFYEKAKNQSSQPQLPLDNEAPHSEERVEESTFRYDGPKPLFRESAIIFLADSIEAASRSLKKVNAQKVSELIDGIFQERLEDGQLDDCPLTFEELTRLKKSFAFTLHNMLHSRVDYPERRKGNNGHKHQISSSPSNAPANI